MTNIDFPQQYDFSSIAVEPQAKKTANHTENGVTTNGNGVTNGNGYHHEINGHHKEILVQNGGH
jgi:hypothetical protein